MKLNEIRDRVAVDAIRWAPKSMFSGLVGWGARRVLPKALRSPVYEVFAHAVGADLSEVGEELEHYPSLSAFFSRRLKPGSRSLPPQEDLWAAPCDSKVAEMGPLDTRTLEAKGQSFSLQALLASERLALALEPGNYVTLYLSPKDYHRVHAPTDCRLVGYEYVPGSLFPVGPLFVKNIDNIFSMNERLVLEFESLQGTFVLVMVGAAGVGNLRLTSPALESRHLRSSSSPQRVRLDTPIDFERGQEVGTFDLGSTVILCVPACIDWQASIGANLKFGDVLARPGEVSVDE